MDLAVVLASVVVFFFFLLLSVRFRSSNRGDHNQLENNNKSFAPLHRYPVIGNLPHFIKNGHRIVEWTSDLIAGSPSGTVVVAPIVCTANPSNLEHMSSLSGIEDYRKGGYINASLIDLLGHGILTANGDLWRIQRKAASHEFSTRSIRSFIHEIVADEILHRLIPFLALAADEFRVFDLQDLLERFAFDNVCRLALGCDPGCVLAGEELAEGGSDFFRAFAGASNLTVERASGNIPFLWHAKRFFNLGSERDLRNHIAIVDKFVFEFLKRSSGGGDSVLSRLAKDLTFSSDEKLLRDVLVNLILAGKDTTPSALTWFFWIVASKPDILEKILDEIESIRAKADGGGLLFFSLEELKEMNYLHAAVTESMRLYPPVPMVARFAAKDDVLPDGTAVGKGWVVLSSMYAAGRSERVWGEDFMEVRPERWLDGAGVFQAGKSSSHAYPVFHGGPRMCLGKEMAYIQMKAVAACVLERFRVEVAEERVGEIELAMTMRMKGGLPVRITERKRKTCV